MDVQDFIRTFKRSEVEAGRYSAARPLILLPDNMYTATVDMCQNFPESRGVLIHSPTLNKYNVLHMIALGYGSSDQVFPSEDRLRAANSLLRENPHLGFIEYHTHTLETGPAYAADFSGMDLDLGSLIANVNRNRNYTHVLFTPTHILTFGMATPFFALTPGNTDTDREMTELDARFREILHAQASAEDL